MSVLELMRYQNEKVYAKYTICQRKRTLPKTSLVFICFLRTKTLKRMDNTLDGETE